MFTRCTNTLFTVHSLDKWEVFLTLQRNILNNECNASATTCSYRLQEHNCKYSMGQKRVFTCSAKTPPKVNRFGWNLEMWAKYGGWPWQSLGAIGAVATVWVESFFQKMQKLLTQLPGLATSGRHNFRNDYKCRKLKMWAQYGGWPWQSLRAIRAVATVWE